jgi:hypothetical protein
MALLLLLLMAVGAIGGIIFAGRLIFGGNSTSPSDEQTAAQKLTASPTDNTVVVMSVRGPVVAAENHYAIAVRISQNARQITTWRGYDGEVLHDQTAANTTAGFTQFMMALSRAGYMDENSNAVADNTGICAVGQVIEFVIFDGDKEVKRLWTTSCAGIVGSFAGLSSNVIQLFLNQIPDSRNIIADTKTTVAR